MHDSPRLRRLRNDLTALERLRAESTVFDFRAQGDPPHLYRITFRGKGLRRDGGKVKFAAAHEVEIKLGSSYPRSIPEIRWLSPIHHPNISEIGMVCLGGYGTHWVPSVQLDELCTMLWDMARYHNFDVRSPYNRDAALWAGNQTAIPFPTDPRPIRDVREAKGRIDSAPAPTVAPGPGSGGPARGLLGAAASAGDAAVGRVRRFLEGRNRPDEERPASAEAEGVVILETTVDEAVVGVEPEAPRAQDDILFIE
ncbi:ubiquitin-conjugating enzyme E2 [Paludisphaera mucosa]|uniref:Ubiquitin-conjugating enzyme E2 n=1 Tax=Paludisphaera mucosa TaxID=3030827 RepID=A0ABT6FGS6_9BACT|nr:ubiquitin-conjugating enzyme E2 [Paludisphaera mucosa]MDG3006774.1 ubiquitin-conjugating enzyme E2 [Paludisphaera mucosa]